MDFEVESGDGALDRLGLVEQRIHRALNHGVAFGIPLADHLVVRLGGERAKIERVHRLHGGVELGSHLGIDLRRLGLDQVRHAGPGHQAPVGTPIGAEIDIADAERVEEMRGVGVVGEAIVLLLGIVEHQPELHALAGKLAIGEAAETGHDRRETRLVAVLLDRLARRAARRPLRRHPGEVVDEEIGRGPEILRAPIAIAVGAFLVS